MTDTNFTASGGTGAAHSTSTGGYPYGYFGQGSTFGVLLLLIVLIIWGPGKLSQVGGVIGKSIRDFRKERRP